MKQTARDNEWTRVESSIGENHELPKHATMRAVKAALGITGRRTTLVTWVGQWREYRLDGTCYTFTVTECY